jgi:large subunit ribosomal protein L29
MPFLRMKDLRDMSSENRANKLDELKTELVRLKTMIGAGGTVDNPSRVKILRKAIARILTVEHEVTHGIRKVEAEKKDGKKVKVKKSETKKAKPKVEKERAENEEAVLKKRKKKK